MDMTSSPSSPSRWLSGEKGETDLIHLPFSIPMAIGREGDIG